jgi:hypothetical protein
VHLSPVNSRNHYCFRGILYAMVDQSAAWYAANVGNLLGTQAANAAQAAEMNRNFNSGGPGITAQQDAAREQQIEAIAYSQPRNDQTSASPAFLANQQLYNSQHYATVGSSGTVYNPQYQTGTPIQNPTNAGQIAYNVALSGGTIGSSLASKASPELGGLDLSSMTQRQIDTGNVITTPSRAVSIPSIVSDAAMGPGGTNTLFVPEGGYASRAIPNAKEIVDKQTGELGIYTPMYDPASGALRGYEMTGGAGRNALQSGMFSINESMAPGNRTYQQGDVITPASLALMATTSRLGSEAYGGFSVPLTGALLSPDSKVSTYANPNNFANLVNPQGPNLSRQEAPGASFPWEISKGSPAIQYANQNGLTGEYITGAATRAALPAGIAFTGQISRVVTPAATTNPSDFISRITGIALSDVVGGGARILDAARSARLPSLMAADVATGNTTRSESILIPTPFVSNAPKGSTNTGIINLTQTETKTTSTGNSGESAILSPLLQRLGITPGAGPSAGNEKAVLSPVYDRVAGFINAGRNAIGMGAGVAVGAVKYASPVEEFIQGEGVTGSLFDLTVGGAAAVGIGAGALGAVALERAGLLGLTGPGAVRSAGETAGDILRNTPAFQQLYGNARANIGGVPASLQELWEGRGAPINLPGSATLPKISDVIPGQIMNAPGQGYGIIANLPGQGRGLIADLPGMGRGMIAKTGEAIGQGFGEFNRVIEMPRSFISPEDIVRPFVIGGLAATATEQARALIEDRPIFDLSSSAQTEGKTVTGTRNALATSADYASKVREANAQGIATATPFWWENARAGAYATDRSLANTYNDIASRSIAYNNAFSTVATQTDTDRRTVINTNWDITTGTNTGGGFGYSIGPPSPPPPRIDIKIPTLPGWPSLPAGAAGAMGGGGKRFNRFDIRFRYGQGLGSLDFTGKGKASFRLPFKF